MIVGTMPHSFEVVYEAYGMLAKGLTDR